MKPIITRHRGKHAILYVRENVITVALTCQLAEDLHFEASIKPKHFQLWVNKKTHQVGIEIVREPTPYSKDVSFNAYGGVMFSIRKVLKDMDVAFPLGSYPMKWEFNRNGFPHLVLGLPMRPHLRQEEWKQNRSNCCNAEIEEGGGPEFEVKPGEPYIYTSYPKCSVCGTACGMHKIKIINSEGEEI